MKQFKSFTNSNATLELDKTPERVAVLGYSAYDTLKALELEDKIVAAPKGLEPDYLGALSEDVKDTKDLHDPDLEAVKEAQPDLIIATSRNSKAIDQLEAIAPVFKYDTASTEYWESFNEVNGELAKIFEKEDKFSNLLGGLNDLIKQIQDKNADLDETTALIMLSKGDFTTFDDKSRFAFLFQELKFKSAKDVKDKAHGEVIPVSEIEDLNPGRIFVIDRTEVVTDEADDDKDMLDKNALQNTDAFKNDKVHLLTADLWYLGSGGLEGTRRQLEEILSHL